MKRFSRFLLGCACLAFLGALAQAATLSGTVTDSSGNPLANVKVIVPSLNKGTLTDSSGHYKIEEVQPGLHVVEFKAVSYPATSKNANLAEGDNTLDAQISGSPLALVPITISAAPKPQSVLTTPAPVSVIEGHALDAAKGQSVMAAIQDEPGVNMIGEGPTVVKPVINGFNSQDVVIAEDGIREDFIQWGNEHAPEISPNGVDKIEVLRGPDSLMYGSDAIGGVIMVTHPDLPNASLGAGPLSGKIDMDAHSVNNGVGQNVMLQGAQGDWGWRGNLGQQHMGNFDTGNEGFIPNTGMDEVNGNGAIGVRKSWGDLQLSYDRWYKHVQLQNIGVYPNPLLDPEYQDLRHDHAVLKGNVLTEALGRIEFNAGYDRADRQEFNGEAGSGNGALGGNAPVGSAGDLGSYWITTTYSAEVKDHLNPMGPFNGILGVQALRRIEQQLEPENMGNGQAPLTPAWNEDGFGEYLYEQAVFGKLTVSAGVRGDQDHYHVDTDPNIGNYGNANDPYSGGVDGQNLNYTAVTGSVGGVYHITDPVAFAVNVGRGFRNPIPFELFGDGVHEGAGVYQIGDPDLKPEQSFNTDAELRWTSDRLKGEVGVFRNYIQDYIYGNYTGTWVPDPSTGYTGACTPGQSNCLPEVQESQSNATVKGVSYSVAGAATDWLTITSGGNLVRGYNNATTALTSWVPEVPADNIRVGAEVHQKKLWDTLYDPYFGLEEKVTNRQSRLAPFALGEPGYGLLNAKIGTQFLVMNNRISIDGGVNNLLNKGYIDFDSLLKEFNIEDPGRDVFVNVSVPFGS